MDTLEPVEEDLMGGEDWAEAWVSFEQAVKTQLRELRGVSVGDEQADEAFVACSLVKIQAGAPLYLACPWVGLDVGLNASEDFGSCQGHCKLLVI